MLCWVQCVARMRAACAGMPIQQLCFQSCPAGVGPDDQGPLLLAARAHSWLCFHEVVPPRQPGELTCKACEGASYSSNFPICTSTMIT